VSRYGVDKLMRHVAQDPNTIREFKDHPEEVIRAFELSEAETRALRDLDYVALYASGAHPQLLLRFIMSVWPGDRRALYAAYPSSVAPHGRPDYST